MKFTRVGAVVLTLVVVALGGIVDRAAGATTEIGAVDEIRSGALPSPISSGGFVVQFAEAAGSTYAVPGGYGTITAWSHSTGGTAGALTFKVYRPTGGPQEFLVVGSDTQTVTARTVHTFPVRIPVVPGDRIGLSSEDVETSYESNSLADRIGFFGSDPPLGATQATDGEPFEEFKLDVAATLESDPRAPEPSPTPSPVPPYLIEPQPAVVSRLSIAPRNLVAARSGPSVQGAKRRRSGTIVSYRVDIAARVRFAVRRIRPGRRTGNGAAARCVTRNRRNRGAARCRRVVPLKGGFAQMARAGSNRFRFTGRLSGRRLKPGAYRLVAIPTANGMAGRAATRGFRIVR